jgi:hypothetical protein
MLGSSSSPDNDVHRYVIIWKLIDCIRMFLSTYKTFLQLSFSTQSMLYLQRCLRFLLVSCLAYSSTLKMEAVCSSETSVDVYRTRWRYIQDDNIL